MDSPRHNADHSENHSHYFTLLRFEIDEHSIKPQHTYNMYKKGLAIRLVERSKRVFSKATWDRNGKCQSLQDSNREWVNVIIRTLIRRRTLERNYRLHTEPSQIGLNNRVVNCSWHSGSSHVGILIFDNLIGMKRVFHKRGTQVRHSVSARRALPITLIDRRNSPEHSTPFRRICDDFPHAPCRCRTLQSATPPSSLRQLFSMLHSEIGHLSRRRRMKI